MVKKIAMVTGANRGIGFEVSKQLAMMGYHVILCGRDFEKANEAAMELIKKGLSVEPMSVDVTKEFSILEANRSLDKKYGKLDVLVNNAGGNFDQDRRASQMDLTFAKDTFDLNLFSSWRMIKTFLPLLRKVKGSRIVNVASGAGSFADPHFGILKESGSVSAYALSKLALNGLTCKLAFDLKADGILVNSVCPGFTATYPGAEEQGARPVSDGAAGIVWAANLPPEGPTGGFFRDKQPIGW
jgi:NAD(P)-dependent dehydrogenase (short-subunit alcohol dehydrogenase family)